MLNESQQQTTASVPIRLEAKIIEAIKARLPDGCDVNVNGSWQPVQSGFVRWLDDSHRMAAIQVGVGSAACVTFTTPAVTLSATVTLLVRYEHDTTGSVFNDLASIIERLFADWQRETYQQAFEALDLDDLSVDNVAVGSGNPPVVDRDRAVVYVSWPLTFSGSYRDPPI